MKKLLPKIDKLNNEEKVKLYKYIDRMVIRYSEEERNKSILDEKELIRANT